MYILMVYIYTIYIHIIYTIYIMWILSVVYVAQLFVPEAICRACDELIDPRLDAHSKGVEILGQKRGMFTGYDSLWLPCRQGLVESQVGL